MLSFGAGSFYFAGNFDKILDWFQQNVHPYGLLAIKFILSFPIVWHPIFGIRHLVWDSGRHYPLKNIMTSGRIMMALAIVGTIVLALSDLWNRRQQTSNMIHTFKRLMNQSFFFLFSIISLLIWLIIILAQLNFSLLFSKWDLEFNIIINILY